MKTAKMLLKTIKDHLLKTFKLWGKAQTSLLMAGINPS